MQLCMYLYTEDSPNSFGISNCSTNYYDIHWLHQTNLSQIHWLSVQWRKEGTTTCAFYITTFYWNSGRATPSAETTDVRTRAFPSINSNVKVQRHADYILQTCSVASFFRRFDDRIQPSFVHVDLGIVYHFIRAMFEAVWFGEVVHGQCRDSIDSCYWIVVTHRRILNFTFCSSVSVKYMLLYNYVKLESRPSATCVLRHVNVAIFVMMLGTR